MLFFYKTPQIRNSSRHFLRYVSQECLLLKILSQDFLNNFPRNDPGMSRKIPKESSRNFWKNFPKKFLELFKGMSPKMAPGTPPKTSPTVLTGIPSKFPWAFPKENAGIPEESLQEFPQGSLKNFCRKFSVISPDFLKGISPETRTFSNKFSWVFPAIYNECLQ